ncbi:Segregation and condensation protein A [Methanosarcina lacustris Z-7289]|uniref:Segregation and condensation protein A n=1 Tax=Methanosarcina lacustris Z-7289 TaxID=1434111 RepID=A0A0E3S4S6_9EURY|nr:ScpA family protein [Methanosarcina lacustris]AKB76099.1 Segregation and condensation protein A [Methanosarcina lacustris Z-7289]
MAELIDNSALDISGLLSPDVRESGEKDSLFSDPEFFGLPSTLSYLGVDWALLDLSEFNTYEPLGILVELAKDGKIDPWDIDVVQLTDSFLQRVEELQKMDLRISSRTLLYSAVLLRMKALVILGTEEEEVDDLDSGFFDDEGLPGPDEFPIPKLPVRRLSTRPVTLNELILELKKAEKTLSRKNEKKARLAAEEPDIPPDALNTGDVLGIAHEEAISSRLELIWARLVELFMNQPVVEFSDLLKLSEDRIMDYLSLLFLASSRKIWLFQNELFEELYIYPGEESGFSTEGNPFLFHQIKQGLTGDVSEPEFSPGGRFEGSKPPIEYIDGDPDEAGYPEVLSFDPENLDADSPGKTR